MLDIKNNFKYLFVKFIQSTEGKNVIKNVLNLLPKKVYIQNTMDGKKQ
jgi:hypothetical protein